MAIRVRGMIRALSASEGSTVERASVFVAFLTRRAGRLRFRLGWPFEFAA
jgi:hypothetical protein